MKEPPRTNPEPIIEISALKQKIKELEHSESERKRASEVLRESEERFRLIADYTYDWESWVGPDGKLIWVNPGVLHLTGYSVADCCAMIDFPLPIIDEADRERVACEFAKAGQGTSWSNFEFRIRCKDGRLKWGAVSYQSVYGASGNKRGYRLSVRDITDRREIESGLEIARKELEATKISEDEAREYAESIINTVRRPLIVLDQDLRVVSASRSFYEVFKVKPEETVGQLIYDLGNKQWDIPKLRELLETILPQKTTFDNYEVEHDFATIGRHIMLLNARQIKRVLGKERVILLAIEDITERKRAEEALRESEERYRELSIVDDLTQLYNFRHFYFQLKVELDRSNRYKQPLTLLLLDLDNFKAFNDAYGHVEGDKVLWRLGQVVKRWLRQTDSAYRYGGEEFTILLPMTTSADGAVTAERIRTEFKKENFLPAPGQDVQVTVSIGLAQYKPQEEMKAFVHRVDQLMYQAKKNGKDRVCSES
jgi:diguanylate cyclase (GGDEF)-like protein/PAS domain S-box-containing protein